jgi:hypothetical protein
MRLRTANEVLLTGHRNHRHLWPHLEQLVQLPLVPLGQRVPLAGQDDVAVVAHALGLVFADTARQQLGLFRHGEPAGHANVRSIRPARLVIVHERRGQDSRSASLHLTAAEIAVANGWYHVGHLWIARRRVQELRCRQHHAASQFYMPRMRHASVVAHTMPSSALSSSSSACFNSQVISPIIA